MTKAKIDTDSYKYGKIRIRNKDGKIRYSRGNGDAVAKALLIHTAAGGKLQDVAKANDLSVTKKQGLNNGQYRMAVGGMLRRLVRSKKPVHIGAITVKRLRQHIQLPKVSA